MGRSSSHDAGSEPARKPLSLRLRSIGGQTIAATVVLLAVVLAVFLAIAWRELNSLGEEQAEARGATVDQATRDMAMSLARNTAVASSAALVESGYLYLHTLVETTARSNGDVRYVFIADDTGRIVVDSRVPLGKTPQEPLTDEISKRIRTFERSEVLAEQDPDMEHLWVFAAPIVVNEADEEATPEARDSVIGHVRVGMSMQAQQREVAAARQEARARVERAIRLAGIVATLLLVFGIIFAVFQGIRISRPIMHLARQAERIAQGELDRRVTPAGATEIQHLSSNFNYMADRISELLEETARKAVLEQELEIARLVQTRLVPPSDTVHETGIDLVGAYEPASECGGDWWLWRKLDDRRIAVLIADVTGHGLPAALITATAIGCTEALPPDTPADEALRRVNRAVTNAGGGNFWMSCFITVFDIEKGTAEFANAGHPIPYVARKKDGRWKLGSLIARGPLLGEELISTIRVRRTEVGPDDIVLWYTDGLNECFGPDGKPWGEIALRRAFMEALEAVDRDKPADVPSAVRDYLIAAVKEFAGGTEQRDDITIVVGTGLGRATSSAASDSDSAHSSE